MIEAANVAPDFLLREKITADQLRHVQDACVVFEHFWLDSDGEKCWAYTIGGHMDGKPLGGLHGGVTIGGEVIVVNAQDRGEADAIAILGLHETLEALEREEAEYIEAHAAQARLDSVGSMRRLELATAAPADKSDEYERDAAAIRKLRGDDIVLTVGGVEEPVH